MDMMESKTRGGFPIDKSTSKTSDNRGHHADSAPLGGTSHDEVDMLRLGKRQQLRRTFTLRSALGFVAIYMATWEFVLVSLSVGFTNGGSGGLFWCYVTTTLAYSSIVLSMAEMASMAPTAGGQYHWVSEFAPPGTPQRVLSYAAGWMTTLGWLASLAGSVYVLAVQVQACVNVLRPDYAFTAWQTTLLMWAILLLTVLFNTLGSPFFPRLETASLVGHVVGFLVVLIPLWVMCDKNDARDVFLTFEDQSGWGNMGAAYLTSQIYVIWCCFGSDSVVHIAEEVENASVVVPRAMIWSYVGNVLSGLLMLITMLFCIGPIDQVIESDWPFIVLFDRTGSTGLNLFFNILLWVLIYLGNITALATCARETWAFARDKGLPFSGFVGHMNNKWKMPFNAIYVISVICMLLSLILLGSDTAFSILVSLSTLGLMSTYMLSIGCLLLKRLRGETLPPARWSLGRLGLAVNSFAFLYSGLICIFCCFPLALPVGVEDANWAPLIWAAVILAAGAMYAVRGKHTYTAPVDFVQGRKAEGVELQQSA